MKNREIKFRVWCISSNSFMRIAQEGYEYHPWICFSMDGKVMHNDNMGGYTYNDQEDFVVQQYTGITDENGKEVYEGDILKCINRVTNSCVYVDWNNHSFRIDGRAPLDFLAYNEIEVAGNIFETPELLLL